VRRYREKIEKNLSSAASRQSERQWYCTTGQTLIEKKDLRVAEMINPLDADD
jgi:hypothetical protein